MGTSAIAKLGQINPGAVLWTRSRWDLGSLGAGPKAVSCFRRGFLDVSADPGANPAGMDSPVLLLSFQLHVPTTSLQPLWPLHKPVYPDPNPKLAVTLHSKRKDTFSTSSCPQAVGESEKKDNFHTSWKRRYGRDKSVVAPLIYRCVLITFSGVGNLSLQYSKSAQYLAIFGFCFIFFSA